MANAQILLLVRGNPDAASLSNAAIAAGRSAGFSPGPWTFASGTSRAARTIGETTQAVFSGPATDGPWAGLTLHQDTAFPATTFAVPWAALRLNLLGGPEGATEAVAAAISQALGGNLIRLASRGPRNAISWDRGVPEPIVLAEAGAPAGAAAGSPLPVLGGLVAVALLAWWASKGTERSRPRSGLSPSTYTPHGVRRPR